MEKSNIKFNILVIVSIIIFCFAISPVRLQNDTFYTIKIGEYILNNGVHIGQDPFSWHENLNYAFPHWAYDVFIYLFYSIDAFTGVYISTCILSSILGLLIYYVYYRLNKNKLISFIMSFTIIYLMRDFIAARAQLFTFSLFLLEVYFIEQFLRKNKKRYAVGLVILPIVIANVHSAVWPFYFILFLPYIADYIINRYLINLDVFYYNFKIKKLNRDIEKAGSNLELIKKLNNKLLITYKKINQALESKNKENFISNKIKFQQMTNGKWLILICLICVFTCFLTPIGDTPYTYLLKISKGTTTSAINEHLPLTLANDKEFSVILFITFFIAIFLNVKLRLKDWFMLLGLMALAFISRRQASMFYLIGLIPVANLIGQIFDLYDKEGTEKVIGVISKKMGIIFTLVLVGLMSWAAYKDKIDDKYISSNNYPIEAADFIINNLDLKNIRLINEYNYGSYLILRGIPVFIDSRCDLYTPEFNEGVNIFEDYRDLYNLNKDYKTILEKYDATHVIIEKSGKLNLLLEKDKDYECIYEDNHFKIYECYKGEINGA